MLRIVACSAILSLGLAACTNTDSKPATQSNKATRSQIVISPTASGGTARPALGRQVGGTSEDGIGVDTEGTGLSGSLMRGMAHVAAANTPASAEARAAFTGSGTSPGDLLRVAHRPIDPKIDYVELLYGYLAAIDPGGIVEGTAFYVDDNGCETDVITRRSRSGTVRDYFVDTTGWQDQVAIELDQPIKRTCTR